MTPETKHFLAKAEKLLSQASGMMSLNYYDAAGRAAYLAGFHGAQALISERTGRSVKSHGGVSSELHRLIRNDKRVDDELRAFLGRTYQLKAIADYETGPGSDVSPELAAQAISTAKAFLEKMCELIETHDPPQGGG